MIPNALLLLAHLLQAPAERLALQHFHDSLVGLDSTALAAVEDRERRAARRGELERLRYGLAALELARAGRVSRFGAAERTFEEVARRRADWPFAWYGL
ncbi:MAG TPA: hypothetical protein VNK43_11905, partial [Gemmatimonadales bacterium]|nr:hypothetical protein [Gemmatimonadales bacterium]